MLFNIILYQIVLDIYTLDILYSNYFLFLKEPQLYTFWFGGFSGNISSKDTIL